MVTPPGQEVFLKEAYSVLVYTESGNILAIDNSGNLILSGISGIGDVAVIQAAVNSLTPGRTWKETVVIQGDFNVLSPGIILPSYTVLDMTTARISKPPDATWPGIRNSGIGDTDIDIVGGFATGNAVSGSPTAHSIEMTGTTNIHIHEMGIRDIRGSCIVIDNSSNVFFNNNRIVTSLQDEGIKITDSENVVVTNNYIAEMDDDGIYIENTTGLVIAENIVKDTANGYGIDVVGSIGHVFGNHLDDNYLSGVHVTGGDINLIGGEVQEKFGATTVSDGDYITHGFGSTPTTVLCTATNLAMCTVPYKNETVFQVAIKKHNGQAGATQDVYWVVK
jgi:parallel beta-helix repeat protein